MTVTCGPSEIAEHVVMLLYGALLLVVRGPDPNGRSGVEGLSCPTGPLLYDRWTGSRRIPSLFTRQPNFFFFLVGPPVHLLSYLYCQKTCRLLTPLRELPTPLTELLHIASLASDAANSQPRVDFKTHPLLSPCIPVTT